MLCSLTKQADPTRAINYQKNFKFDKNFEPKQIGLEKSLNVLVMLLFIVSFLFCCISLLCDQVTPSNVQRSMLCVLLLCIFDFDCPQCYIAMFNLCIENISSCILYGIPY